MTRDIFFHLNSHKIFFWFFIATFLLQILFWNHATKNYKPELEIVPPAPNKYLRSALSLGDEEFLFRILGTRLQNSGDVFAGFVALKKYNYKRVYDWMTALDDLNSESDFIPSLASYYYSQTQNRVDSKYIIDYLDEHASRNLDKKWWWMFQAVFVAKKSLQNNDIAYDLAYKLSKNNAKNAPLWTKQLPAFISKEMGDDCLSFKLLSSLVKDIEEGKEQATIDEMNYMRYYINERLNSLKKKKFNPKKCLN
ncbi:MAG: hypothetical protein ISQ34_02975 [Rickettsiales bacterium]|nr:hypothetical protein [Rickettsiales bacterium]